MTKFIFLLFPILLFSQQKTGLVHYGELQSMGMGAPVGADYNAILVFDKNASLYITRKDSLEGGHINKIERYKTGENSGNISNFITNKIGFRYYNDYKNDMLYSRDLGFSLIKESLPQLAWEIHDTTKKIGELTCTKATSKFRGRNYTAWFTTEIPLTYGPWKLQGLPGLILEAYDTNKEIYWYFKSIDYPCDYQYLLKPIENKPGNWMTYKDQKNKLWAAYNKSIIGGRMVAESADVTIKNDKEKQNLLERYIEGFEIDNAE